MLDHFLVTCRDRRLVTARGQQRTDATQVLAAIRTLNRLECLGETLAHTLHQLLWDAPGWARTTIPAAWWDRYGPRFGQFRLPKTVAERAALAVAMGVVDSAYPDADGLVRSQAQGSDLIAPVQHASSGQAQADAGFPGRTVRTQGGMRSSTSRLTGLAVVPVPNVPPAPGPLLAHAPSREAGGAAVDSSS